MRKKLMILLCFLLVVGLSSLYYSSKKEKEVVPIIKTNRIVSSSEKTDFEYFIIGESLYVKNNSDKDLDIEFSFEDADGLQQFYSVEAQNIKQNKIKELLCTVDFANTDKSATYKAFEPQYKAITIYPSKYSFFSITTTNHYEDCDFYYDSEKNQFYYYDKDGNTEIYCDKTGKQNVEINIDEQNKSSYDWTYRFNSKDDWIDGGLNQTKKEISEELNLIEPIK